MNAFRFLSFTASDALSVFVRKAVKSTLKLRWLFLFFCLILLTVQATYGQTEIFSDSFDNNRTTDNSSAMASRTGWGSLTKVYEGAYGTLKLGTGSAIGSITKTAMGSSVAGKTLTITFTVKKYGSDTGKLNVSISGGGTASGDTQVTPTTNGVSATVTIANATANTTITFATSSKRAYLDDVVITASSGSSCTNTVTVTKGPETNGTFDLSATSVCGDSPGGEVTVSNITPASGYLFSTITATNGTVDNTNFKVTGITANTTIGVTFTPIPTYTVEWYVGTNKIWTESVQSGSTATLPATPSDGALGGACATGKTFVGWSETNIGSTPAADPGNRFTEAPTITSAKTYYAVFATATGGGSSHTLTKMKTGDTFSDGDKIVIVAEIDANTVYALYQETVSTSYVKKWTFDNSASTVAADDKNWLTVTETTDGWYIGDDTNGYLNNSENLLYCDNDKSVWVLEDKSDGTFQLKSGTKYLSNRSDLTGDNQYKWRMGNTGTNILSLYKFTTSSVTYSSFITLCPATTCTEEPTVATGGTTSLTATGATLTNDNGITDLGDTDCSIVTYGYVVGTAENPAIGGNGVTDYSLTTAYTSAGTAFSQQTITGLTSGTTYHVRCYAQNYAGIAYSDDFQFTTLPYTVTLDAGNGSILSSSLPTVNGVITLPDATPSVACGLEGWTFAGWKIGGELSETTSAPTLISSGEYAPDNDITLYAVYKQTSNVTPAYNLVTSDLGTAWAGDYLIAFDNETFADGRTGGTDGMGAQNASVDPSDNLDGTTVDATWGDTYHVTLEEISDNSNTYLLKTQDGKYNYQSSNSNGLASTDNASTADDYPISITFTSSSDIKLRLGGSAQGAVFRYNEQGYFRFYKDGSQSAVYLYKKTGEATSYASSPSCCTAPATVLTLSASATELVGQGEVELTLQGGNGKNITWSTTSGTLSNQSNSGATLTLSSPGIYTVTATQPDDEQDENNICGAELSVEIEVKQQHTITYKYILDGVGEVVHSTVKVTDGEGYTLPDISEEFTCSGSETFAGWASATSATTVEATAGSSQTATADKTWYAVWGESSAHNEIVNVYTLVTDISQVTAGSEVVIGGLEYWSLLGKTQNKNNRSAEAPLHDATDDDNLWFSSAESVAVLTLGGNATDGWTLFDATYLTNGGYLFCNTTSKNTLQTESTLTNGRWDIEISSNGDATIESKSADGKYLQYNANNNIFACYSNTQEPVALFVKTTTTKVVSVEASSSVSTSTTCTSGAVLLADDNKWITSSNGQKVRCEINVVARGFDETQTLTATSDNDKFIISLSESSVPTIGLSTSLIVEYTPTTANTHESAIITLTAGSKTKQITVNGRSLPDEFVIIAADGNKWYALPANMNSDAGTFMGVEVQPNAERNIVPTVPSTLVYTHRAVANERYETSGHLARLVGNDNRCLWASKSTNSTSIRNYAQFTNTNSEQYEWLLSTNNGNVYSISLPANADAAAGRQLSLSGTKYGNYKSAGELYILPVGCSSLPTDVSVSPRRVQATFTWQSNANSVTIEIRVKETNNIAITQTFSDVPAIITGLEEKTEYTYRIIPDDNDNCAAEGEFVTTGPTIDIAEWKENAVIIQVDKDDQYHPKIIIDGEVESGVEGATATELFFSKYFEGEGSMKLLGIFNGTRNDIDLNGYMVRQLTNVTAGTKDFDLSPLGAIKAGQELILFSRPLRKETNLYDCSKDFLDAMSAKSAPSDNPRWVECYEKKYFDLPTMNFNGNDALVLLKNGAPVDVFGATEQAPTGNNCRSENSWLGTVKNMDKDKTIDKFPYITGGGDS